MASAQAKTLPASTNTHLVFRTMVVLAVVSVVAILVWEGITAAGNPKPIQHGSGSLAGIIDIGVLVFREGLECVLVLSAITAGLVRSSQPNRRPIAAGAAAGFLATIATWFVAVGVVDDLSRNLNALYVQAATGLLAVLVLLVVMNWFFHKIYWTGWIGHHNKRKHELLEGAAKGATTRRSLFWGMVLLGFTSFYREGVEVVLFLQSYRLKLGGQTVFYGVLIGLLLTSVVAVLTFQLHRKLPYKRMLIFTGVMLGAVLLIMVGEQAQEMQAAGWLPTTVIPMLADRVPAWTSLWFSIFPTVETLAAQGLAAAAVAGSYFIARK